MKDDADASRHLRLKAPEEGTPDVDTLDIGQEPISNIASPLLSSWKESIKEGWKGRIDSFCLLNKPFFFLFFRFYFLLEFW